MSEPKIENDLALIEKAQQLAGHFPDADALDRARRILNGSTTPAEAYAELDEKYGSNVEDGRKKYVR
ncbi:MULTISPECIES: hypothetical protein [unclassified Microbacterium]|uniref:hypothetical protein n=1 Tax=unclassified Microbacterium TaxID=2609290 RepID=UPI000D01E861|nr:MULTISPECIES: hypothetical protein [unclassified Microbacterium]AVL97580.1 hypothetical protein C6C15_10970 [Microbacterium sp. str. 'China']MDH5134277.1 hypothetical protein [Microbacterium sp. RD10]MDH5138049.1 hypothetical protein [Microbacterium sp. RD11]MDH5145462.1 hypothetical protein [Microbacterium sp. RD12]MDH5156002.1 hypothetical protein [Microbacterium sp. RD06]